MDPISRSSTPGSEVTVRPRLIRDNSSPYRNKGSAGSNASSQTLLPGVAPPQRDHPRSDTGKLSSSLYVYLLLTNPDTGSTISTVVSHDREMCTEKPSVSDLVASSFLLVGDAAAVAMAQARDDLTYQPRRPASMLSLRSLRSHPIEPDVPPQVDDNIKHKPRHSRFHIRQRLGKVFDPILHATSDTRK